MMFNNDRAVPRGGPLLMQTFYSDRSRYETTQRCRRARWYEYHEGPARLGLSQRSKPLPLAVGGAVHHGLERLLRDGQSLYTEGTLDRMATSLEQDAVNDALADLAQYRSGGLALDTTEQAQQGPGSLASPVHGSEAELAAQLAQMAADLGVSTDEARQLYGSIESGREEFDRWLWAEQSALVEALVRAYARRRLRPLLEEYEVLEVEREGEWELASWHSEEECVATAAHPTHDEGCHGRLMFLSRPDALLRDRRDNSLYLLSYKTAASWDVRKERDAQHDMQGLSEGIEVEKRLGEWWERLRSIRAHENYVWSANIPHNMAAYLRSLPEPPRILGIRYEYLLKGERWVDDDLSRRVGFTARGQKSHLVRAYVAKSVPRETARTKAFYSVGDRCWSYDYIRDDGTPSKLAWQNWRPEPQWDQPGGIRAWIDLLDQTAEELSGYDSTVGQEPRMLGWKSPAQALGYTSRHPLDAVFLPPFVVYRNDDDLRDMVEQLEASEQATVQQAAEVWQASGEDDRRSLLNCYFPQSRRACEYPSTCPWVPVCYGNEDVRRDPMSTGLYQIRTPNHPQEGDGTTLDRGMDGAARPGDKSLLDTPATQD